VVTVFKGMLVKNYIKELNNHGAKVTGLSLVKLKVIKIYSKGVYIKPTINFSCGIVDKQRNCSFSNQIKQLNCSFSNQIKQISPHAVN